MADSLQFTVAGKSIRMQSQELGAGSRQPAILLLHGAGGNLDFWLGRFGPLLQGVGIGLYAPHYFDRTETVRADMTAITDGIHVPQWLDTVSHALDMVRSRPAVDPDRIALLGISLGAFLGLAYAALRSAAPASAGAAPGLRAVVDISGGLVEPYNGMATGSFPPTLLIHGATDSIVPAIHAHALDRRLTELDVAHRTEILPGEGHWFTPAAAPRLLLALSSFLQEHLRLQAPQRAM